MGLAPVGAHSFRVSNRCLMALAFFLAFSFHAQRTKGPGKIVGTVPPKNIRGASSKASSAGTMRPLMCACPGSGKTTPMEAAAGGKKASGPGRTAYGPCWGIMNFPYNERLDTLGKEQTIQRRLYR